MRFTKGASPHRIAASVNMTPMIDVVFQLIIFFVTVADFAQIQIEEVQLPVADKAKVEEVVPPSRLVVNVDAAGRLIVASHRIDFATLAQWLNTEAASHKTKKGEVNVEVLVRSDGRAEFGRIQDVMLECARNGIWQISFAAMTEEQPPEEESEGM